MSINDPRNPSLNRPDAPWYRPPVSGEPSGRIVVLPPASWAEGAADLLERALYLRSMSIEDAAPVEAAITDHLNHSMRSTRPPASGEPSTAHEHDWIDAPDDETGWYCPTCGVTEYPSDEHEQLANDLYCVVAQPETIWWDDLPPEMQKGWMRAADLVKQRVDSARAEGAGRPDPSHAFGSCALCGSAPTDPEAFEECDT